MRFYIARSGATRALFMSWQADAPLAAGQSAAAKEVMLLDHVALLRLAYFGLARPGDGSVWLDRWTNRDRLPELVRVGPKKKNYSFDLDQNAGVTGDIAAGTRVKVTYTKDNNGQKVTTVAPYGMKKKSSKKAA